MATFEGTPGNDTLEGTEGSDVITGDAGNDSLSGLGGDDIIFGGTGNDTMRGGEGNDTFVSDTAVGAEIFDGGADTDTIELRTSTLQIVTLLGNTSIHGLNTSQLISIERLVFNSQAGELIQGQIFAPQVVSSGLNEVVGGVGTDLFTLILTPGSSKPTLTFTGFDAAPDNAWDQLTDRVTLVATTSTTLSAYAGLDVFQVLAGSAGNDTLIGSDNADILSGGAGVNALHGGGGNDMLVLINQATPNPSAGTFNPPSFLTGEGSLFDGGEGFDLIGIGGYVFFLGAVQDIEGFNLLPGFTPPALNTPLQEPAYLSVNASTLASLAVPYFRGVGTVSISPSDPVTFEARSFDGSNIVIEEGSDIQIVIDGADNDGDNITIIGSSYDDEIFMGDGAQSGFGGDGDDIINIADGDQTVTGGAGADRFQIDDISSGEAASSTAVITDFILGEDKIDLDETGVINVRRAFDFLTQGPDGAVIGASSGGYSFTVTLQGVDLADLTASDFLVDTSDDTLFPRFETDSGLADIMMGGALDDSLIGGEGDDTIYTGGGRDTIDGGNGNDRIIADGAIPAFTGGPSPVQFNGGAGFDVLELRSFEGSVESPWDSQLSTYAFLFNVGGIEEFEFASLAGEWVSTNLLARSVVVVPNGAPFVANLPLPTHLRGGEGMDTVALVAAGGMGGAAEILVPTFAFHDWDAPAKAYLPGDALVYVGADGAGPTSYAIRANDLNAQQDVLQHLIGGGGNDTLIGSQGMDLLNGNGGTNLLQGLGGDDALAISNSAPSGGAPTTNTGAGSVFDGGDGIDFLTVGGVVDFQGTLLDIEGIHLQKSYTLNNGAFGSQARAQLTISFSEISKLGPNARFDGVGDIFVTLGLNDNLDTSGFVFEAGSDVTIDLGGGDVTGTSGNDSLTGTGGPDTFFLGGGRDTVVAGGGNDTVVVNGPVIGGSNLNGGPGIDTLLVGQTNLSTVASSQFPSGIDSYSNGILGSTVTGFERLAFDSTAGTASNFAVLWLQANSSLVPGATLVGGDGYDTLQVIGVFNNPGSYVLNAPVYTYDNWQEVDRAYQPGDRVLVLNAGNANGVINGSSHAGVQVLVGGAGNETINGSDNMDFLAGGLGVNQLFGGGDDDTLFFGNSIIVTNNNGVVTTAPETTNDAAGWHFDGGAGFDFLMIGGNVNFQGALANLEGIYLAPAFTNPDPPTNPTQVTSTQRQNYTTLTIDNSLFQLFPRALEVDGVGTIHVEIEAGTRFDGSSIVFTDGSDVRFLLEGSVGNDIIIGTAGEDTFEGDSGTDFFVGGAGNDVFRLSLGAKIVTDFTLGEDRVDVSELGLASLAEVQALFTQVGSDARFSFVYGGQTNRMVLQNVQLGDLAASDFVFASPTLPRVSDATELADLIVGQGGNDLLSGLGGNDTIRSGGGLDTIDGGEGNDTVLLNGLLAAGSQMNGGIGIDTLVLTEAAGNQVLNVGQVVNISATNFNGFETLRFDSSAGSTLVGEFGAIQVFGRIATIVGGAGVDIYNIVTPTLGGGFAWGAIAQSNWTVGVDKIVLGNALGTGALTVSVTDHAGQYVLVGGSGNDSFSAVGANSIEVLNGNGGDDSLSGGGGNDTLDGGAGNDTLNGGAGSDSMVGGAGDDLFILDNTGDIVVELAGGGNDTVTSATLTTINASSFGEIEVIRYTGAGNAALTGTDGNNTLTGSSGSDTLTGGQGDDRLDGGTGADTMFGGQGNDTFFIDNLGDRGVEADGEGIDTFVTSLSSFNLLDYQTIENLTITFAGGAVLTGNFSANVLTGADGNDTLDGLSGADTLDGGLGDDLYTVDDALDVIIDSGGIDTVRAKLSWTLADGLERLDLLVQGTGTGNAADNTITGTAGLDSLYGGDGNDELIGGAGGDLLDGGTGSDTMRGGLGLDTYIVDHAGDVVDETGGDGIDTVLVSLNDYTLTAGVERLTFTGTGNFSGNGNTLANGITGGAGNDFLDGGAGNDTLDGGLGDDTYMVDSATDVIRDTGGIDRVYTQAFTYTLTGTVEHLYFANVGNFTGTGNGLGNEISGGSGNDLLSGLGGADTIGGNDGNDTVLGGAGNDSLLGGQGSDLLVGGLGRDFMVGGADADVFRFDTLTDTRTGANADQIADFSVGQDRIDVSNIDPNATLAGDQSYAFIGTAAFSAIAGQAEARFVNSGGNTLVHFDNDGNGTIDMSLVLTGTHALTAAEFIL